MTALFKPSEFDPARAKATARRLREGKPPIPMFAGETKKAANDVVISSIGRAAPEYCAGYDAGHKARATVSAISQQKDGQ